MKIESLNVHRLYGLYDYNIRFNPNLTFLIGTNGSGKTTILNIIAAIISGRIYNLFEWDFDRIRLKYYDDELSTAEIRNVVITYEDSKDIRITWKDKTKTIKRENYNHLSEDADSTIDLFRMMQQKYPFIEELKNEFHYVYLPLNRSSAIDSERRFPRRFMWDGGHSEFFVDLHTTGLGRDQEVVRAEKLVSRKYAEASARVRALNDDFRDRILKSLLNTETQLSNESLSRFINESMPSNSLETTKEQYFKLLDSLDLLNEVERDKYNQLFADYVDLLGRIRKRNENGGGELSAIPIIHFYHEIEKMKMVIPLAEEIEKKKADAMSRIDLFVNTMNSFLRDRDGDKELVIDETGRIMFMTAGREGGVSVSHLSSGEKQLLVFFASLVFRVDDNASSIFVVDEPELSLHLSWQNKFVDKALGINNNMQLIFATHAPEIIGRHKDKARNLVKTIASVEDPTDE